MTLPYKPMTTEVAENLSWVMRAINYAYQHDQEMFDAIVSENGGDTSLVEYAAFKVDEFTRCYKMTHDQIVNDILHQAQDTLIGAFNERT